MAAPRRRTGCQELHAYPRYDPAFRAFVVGVETATAHTSEDEWIARWVVTYNAEI
jgi:hypothetical protein